MQTNSILAALTPFLNPAGPTAVGEAGLFASLLDQNGALPSPDARLLNETAFAGRSLSAEATTPIIDRSALLTLGRSMPERDAPTTPASGAVTTSATTPAPTTSALSATSPTHAAVTTPDGAVPASADPNAAPEGEASAPTGQAPTPATAAATSPAAAPRPGPALAVDELGNDAAETAETDELPTPAPVVAVPAPTTTPIVVQTTVTNERSRTAGQPAPARSTPTAAPSQVPVGETGGPLDAGSSGELLESTGEPLAAPASTRTPRGGVAAPAMAQAVSASETQAPTPTTPGADIGDLLEARRPAPATPTPATPLPLADAPVDATVDEVAVHVARAATSGKTELQIRLHPQELGRIDVHLAFDGDRGLQIQIVAEEGRAVELLQRHGHELERALQQNGFDLARDGIRFDLGRDAQQQQLARDGGRPGSEPTANDPSPDRGAEEPATSPDRLLDPARLLDLQA